MISTVSPELLEQAIQKAKEQMGKTRPPTQSEAQKEALLEEAELVGSLF